MYRIYLQHQPENPIDVSDEVALNAALEQYGNRIYRITALDHVEASRENPELDKVNVLIGLTKGLKARAKERYLALGLESLSQYLRVLIAADYQHELLELGRKHPDTTPQRKPREPK